MSSHYAEQTRADQLQKRDASELMSQVRYTQTHASGSAFITDTRSHRTHRSEGTILSGSHPLTHTAVHLRYPWPPTL